MKYPGLRIRTLAVLFALLILGVLAVSPAARAEFLGLFEPETPPAVPSSSELLGPPVVLSATDAFHWLDPIAPSSGDTANLDTSLLKHLNVEVCQVTGSGCTTVKTFTSASSSAEQLRIVKVGSSGGYYIANWDTQKAKISLNATYRIIVSIPGLQLGSIDLAPATYRTFGRTWPIKFLVEKNAVIRTTLLSSHGLSMWEVADELRSGLGVCGDELSQVLLSTYPNATAEEVEMVVNGVCQEVVMPSTTKIADTQTRDALSFYDPATGHMEFAAETDLLKNLKIGDVIASKPSAAAPYGYLRKVTSVRKVKGTYIVEGVQAKLYEAITKGTMQSAGTLLPSTGTGLGARLLAPGERNAFGASLDEGDQLTVDQPIDVTINFEEDEEEEGDVDATGTVRIEGHVFIRAGYNIGAGIEPCVGLPPVCVDRLEAWMGFEQKSNLRVTGNFKGTVKKEKTIYPVPMQPIIFFIGFLPVVLVPQMNVIVGIEGKAEVNFEFAAQSEINMKPYLKWTEDEGWKDLSEIGDPLEKTFLDADMTGTIQVEAYAKLDASLLLYGAIGPSVDGSLGIGGKAQLGQSPLWQVYGHAQVGIGLRSIFTELFGLDSPREALLDETFHIKSAEKLPPDCSARGGVIPVDIDSPVFLGPSGNGIGGYFNCTDPDGDSSQITYSAVSTNGDDRFTNMWTRFLTAEQRTITITATDWDGQSEVFSLTFQPQNALPVITPFAATNTVGVGVQYFINALVYDWENRGYLGCGSFGGSPEGVKFFVEAPNTLAPFADEFNCSAEVIFATPGLHRIKITAVDRHSGYSEQFVDVNVTAAPSDLAPVIDRSSINFSAIARTTILRSRDGQIIFCFPGGICPLPNGESLDIENGTLFDYIIPFHLNFNATDPNGQTLTKKWYCRSGTTTAEMTQNGDGSFACGAAPPGVPTFVWGTVSDGTTTVPTDMRNYILGSGLR